MAQTFEDNAAFSVTARTWNKVHQSYIVFLKLVVTEHIVI